MTVWTFLNNSVYNILGRFFFSLLRTGLSLLVRGNLWSWCFLLFLQYFLWVVCIPWLWGPVFLCQWNLMSHLDGILIFVLCLSLLRHNALQRRWPSCRSTWPCSGRSMWRCSRSWPTQRGAVPCLLLRPLARAPPPLWLPIPSLAACWTL